MTDLTARTNALNLSDIPLVDAHCHALFPIAEPLTVASCEQWLSLALKPEHQIGRSTRRHVRDWPPDAFPRPLMSNQLLWRLLGRFLGAADNPAEIVAARNRRAGALAQYTRALMDDAGLEQLVVDTGFPAAPFSPDVSRAEFAELTGRPVWELVRIDMVMARLAEQHETFAGFLAAYREHLDAQLRDPHVVGLKSVIAYLTGLEVQIASRQDAASQYPAYRRSPLESDHKALRDFCLRVAVELCVAHDKPLQIHSGAGDDYTPFDRVAPRNLWAALNTSPFTGCLIVLVHGGFPWVQEAAYMARVLGNVFLDFSAACPTLAYGVSDALWEILQLAPINKVMYGSDAFHLPEAYWLAAHLGRQATGRVLARLVAQGVVTEAEARVIGRQILHDNAIELYQLDGHRQGPPAESAD